MQQGIAIGIALIVLGLLYLVKPDLFKRWFWKRTSIAQRLLSPENYKKYMRVLGVILIVIGVALIVIGVSNSQ